MEEIRDQLARTVLTMASPSATAEQSLFFAYLLVSSSYSLYTFNVRGVTRYNIPFYLYPTLSMNGFSALPVCVRVFISILCVDESLCRYTFNCSFNCSYFILLIFFVAEISLHQKCTLTLYIVEQNWFSTVQTLPFPIPFARLPLARLSYSSSLLLPLLLAFSSLSLATFDYMQILFDDFDSWLRQWLWL